MSFINASVLYCLVLVPFFILFYLWLSKRGLEKVHRLFPQAIKQKQSIFYVQLTLFSVALCLLVISLARPTWGEEHEKLISSNKNVLILLDVSRSMLAKDVIPNRLERSKLEIAELVKELRGARVGIMAFRSAPVMICPFTSDEGFVNLSLNGITINSAPLGETNFKSSIERAITAFPEDTDDDNYIIMISDGEDLTRNYVAAAEAARDKNIPIYCIGVGETSGAKIEEEDNSGFYSYEGEEVVTRLNNSTLKEIANITRGKYLPLFIGTAGARVLAEQMFLASSKREKESEEFRIIKKERYELFLFPAIILLFIVAALSRGMPRSVKIKKSSNTTLVTFILLVGSLFSTKAIGERSSYDYAREGFLKWQSGDYATSYDLYTNAVHVHTKENDDLKISIMFNAGVSALSIKKYDEAIENFENVATIAPSSFVYKGIASAYYEKAKEIKSDKEDIDENIKNLAKRISLLEKCASNLKNAILFDKQQDESLENNLLLAGEELETNRNEYKLLLLESKYGKDDIATALKTLRDKECKIYEEVSSIYEDYSLLNAKNLQSIKLDQEEVADVWKIVLEKKILEQMSNAITNEVELAQAKEEVEKTGVTIGNAAIALEGFDKVALDDLKEVERNLLLYVIGFQQLPSNIELTSMLQTNALIKVDLYKYTRTPVENHLFADELYKEFDELIIDWLNMREQQFAQQQSQNQSPDNADATNNQSRLFTEDELLEIETLRNEIKELFFIIRGRIAPQDKVLSDDCTQYASRNSAALKRLAELLNKNPNNQQNQQDNENQENKDNNQNENENKQNQDNQQNQQDKKDNQNQDQSNEDSQNSQDSQDQEESSPQEPQEEKSAEDIKEEQRENIFSNLEDIEKQFNEEKNQRKYRYNIRTNIRDW